MLKNAMVSMGFEFMNFVITLEIELLFPDKFTSNNFAIVHDVNSNEQ